MKPTLLIVDDSPNRFLLDAIVRATEALPEDIDVVLCRAADGAGAEIQASEPWKPGNPVSFMYFPAGTTTITAGFRGKAVRLTVAVDQKTADVVQASFDQWRNQYPKQKPFACFEHEEKEASVWPNRFEWKGDGVYMAAEPSQMGADQVNGKVRRSFSPSFVTDADYAKASDNGKGVLVFPEGARGSETNPAAITGIAFCVGTLTNKPAFKNISPVKAKDASGQPDVVSAATGAYAAGHEFHGNQYTQLAATANESSRVAHAASAEAHGKDFDASKHVAAARAHRTASEAHRTAGAYHLHDDNSRRSGNMSYHHNQARMHEEHAYHHEKLALERGGMSDYHARMHEQYSRSTAGHPGKMGPASSAAHKASQKAYEKGGHQAHSEAAKAHLEAAEAAHNGGNEDLRQAHSRHAAQHSTLAGDSAKASDQQPPAEDPAVRAAEKDYTLDSCPECGGKVRSACRCPINDRTCDNGHTWHWKDGNPVLGSGHGKTNATDPTDDLETVLARYAPVPEQLPEPRSVEEILNSLALPG